MVFAITRRVHLIGCGMPKSGTTSVATMLAPVLRARHEFEMDEAARVRLREQAGQMTRGEVEEWLVARDERCNAEVDSTSFLWNWSEALPGLFPDARFVATVRPPQDWCRSLAGMLLAMQDVTDEHLAWGEAVGVGDIGPRPLEDPRVFLRAALDYWRLSARAIALLPPDRTWWCRTEDLSARADDLAAWAGVHPDWLRRAPANKSRVTRDEVRAVVADEWVRDVITAEDEVAWGVLSDLAG